MFLLSAIIDLSGFSGSYSLIYLEKGGKNYWVLFRDSNWAKICNLLQMLIFLWWNSDACDVNQWDLNNSRADTDIKWSKYQSSLYISNNMCLSKMRLKWSKHNAMLRWRNKVSSEDVMKIIPPLRNSESKASGNKRSSKDPDDQIWD